MALEDGEIQGALIDTYVIAEHKESLLSDRIFVKKMLDRPFGYGVVLSGAARNVELRCRDYINMKITDIFQIIQNTTKTLDVSLLGIDCYSLLQRLMYGSIKTPSPEIRLIIKKIKKGINSPKIIFNSFLTPKSPLFSPLVGNNI